MGESRWDLPEGFGYREAAGWRLAVRSGFSLPEEALDPERLAASGEPRYSGRGRPVRVALEGGGAGVLRRYRHGGLLRRLTGTIFSGPSRPLAELRATERARRAGVAVPEVLAIWHRGRALLFHEGFILTREVAGARDLVAALTAGAPVSGAFLALGGEIRKMHDAGVVHGDLHVKNVLIEGGEVTILDFDRARIEEPVSEPARVENLLRFHRSLVKLARRGVPVSRTDRLRLFAGYYPVRPDAAARAGIVRRCRRGLAVHRLLWPRGGGSR